MHFKNHGFKFLYNHLETNFIKNWILNEAQLTNSVCLHLFSVYRMMLFNVDHSSYVCKKDEQSTSWGFSQNCILF